jgi:hypothetical protein
MLCGRLAEGMISALGFAGAVVINSKRLEEANTPSIPKSIDDSRDGHVCAAGIDVSNGCDPRPGLVSSNLMSFEILKRSEESKYDDLLTTVQVCVAGSDASRSRDSLQRPVPSNLMSFEILKRSEESKYDDFSTTVQVCVERTDASKGCEALPRRVVGK